MITGKANYRLLQQLTALPLVDFPVLLTGGKHAQAIAVDRCMWVLRDAQPNSSSNSAEAGRASTDATGDRINPGAGRGGSA